MKKSFGIMVSPCEIDLVTHLINQFRVFLADFDISVETEEDFANEFYVEKRIILSDKLS